MIYDRMGRKRKRPIPGVPIDADFKTRRGNIYVRVDWDDTSRGDYHYVPVKSLKCSGTIAAGSRVSMRHSGGRAWTGTVAVSPLAARSLVQGKMPTFEENSTPST